MSRMLWLLLFSLFCLLPVPTRSQTCEALTTNICNEVITEGTPIFVPYGFSLDLLQTYASRLVNVLNVDSVIQDPCRSYILFLICGTWLRPCYSPSPNVTIPIPQQPCLETCWNWYNVCTVPGQFPTNFAPLGEGFFFPPGYAAPLNCSNVPIDVTAFDSPFYQAGSAVYDVGGIYYTVPCSLSAPVQVPYDITCQSPLIVATSSTGYSTCAFSCPLPSLSDSEYESAKTMQGILGWFSWVTSALLLITLIVPPRTRDFPRNLVIMVAAAANIAAGAIILPTYAGYDNTWCGGSDVTLVPALSLVSTDAFGFPTISFNIDESVLDFSSSLCTFQGAMLQFGFLAAVFWWVIIAFNMCLELYFGRLLNLDKTRWKWLRFGIYNLVGWGLAFILMVIPAAADRIKFAPAGTYCFVTGEDNYAWSLTFWFVPVGISMLLGVILFVLALIRVTILFITLRKMKNLIYLYVRLLIFVLLYLILFVFISVYNIQYSSNSSEINSGYEAYYQCLLFQANDCSLSDSITNYNLVMLKGFAISSLGVLLFFLFLSWDVILFWYNLFKSLVLLSIHRKKDNAIAVLKMVAYSQSVPSLTGSASMSITELENVEGEENDDVDADDTGVDDPDEEEEPSTSSSEE